MPNALAGFQWKKGENPQDLPQSSMYCVRKALCLMMGWPPGSEEWYSFPPGPPGTDLLRLVTERPELGLELHAKGDHVPGKVRGIVVGKVPGPKGPVDHAEYGEVGYVASNFLDNTIAGVITRQSE